MRLRLGKPFYREEVVAGLVAAAWRLPLNPGEAELRGTSALPVRFLANEPTPTQEKDMKSLLIMMAIAAAVGACSFHSETVQRPAPVTATVVTTPPPPPPVVYVPE
jgi:hypothetical protein